MVIRKIKYKDIEQIVDININDWKIVYKGIIDEDTINNLNRDKKIERWKKTYNKNATAVAEENGKVVGYCKYMYNVNYENTDIDCELLAIYVDYNNIRKGTGRKLIEYVKNDLKSKGKKKMVVWCLEKNKLGRNFYEKTGGKLITPEKYFETEGKKYKEVGYLYNI